VPISIPESLVVALPPIQSPSSRTFVELTPRQLAPTVGIAATGFCHPDGILQVFRQQRISKFYGCRAAAIRSHLAELSIVTAHHLQSLLQEASRQASRLQTDQIIHAYALVAACYIARCMTRKGKKRSSRQDRIRQQL
jgi:hypothetical protein